MERKTIYIMGWAMLACVVILIVSHALMGYNFWPLFLLLIPCLGLIATLENM